MSSSRPERYASEVEDLRRDGFVVVRSVVDGHALGRVVDEYEATFLPNKHISDVRRETYGAAGADGLGRVVHVSNVFEMATLAELAADPQLLQLASSCLGGVPVRPVLNTELFDKPPGGNTTTQTPPHQDNFYFRAAEPGIAVWITLDELNNDSGTVQFVRGSHLKGLRYHDWDSGPAGFAKTIYDFTDEDEDGLVEVGQLHPGDVVVHHGLTIHYAPPNITQKRRRGLVVNYVAGHTIYSLADDLHKPSLVFSALDGRRLQASVWKGWHERHALAASCIRCTLRGCLPAIECFVEVDSDAGTLQVELTDSTLFRRAVLALIQSGHVVRGVDAIQSMPQQLADFEVPAACSTTRDMVFKAQLPDDRVGVWTLFDDSDDGLVIGENIDFAVQMQARCGVYVHMRIPRSVIKMRSVDLEACSNPMSLTLQHLRVGMTSLHGDNEQIVLRRPCLSYQPFSVDADVGRIQRRENDKDVFVETSLLGHSCTYNEMWMRVDGSDVEKTAVLQLIGDEDGRQGVWLVLGTWFARVVGRRSSDVLSDLVCKSLMHAFTVYEDILGIDAEAAVHEFESSIGRVEAPGIFRILHDLDPARVGTLCLDDTCRQLRRNAVEDDILVEAWSSRRWRIRELPHKFAPFGHLKRTIAR